MSFHMELRAKIQQMKRELHRITLQSGNEEWTRGTITLQFPPFINRSYKMQPVFWDAGGNKVRVIPKYDSQFETVAYDLIKSANAVGSYNEIKFDIVRNDFGSSRIELGFNQAIVDKFEQNLSNDERGKTIPWWSGTQL